MTLGIISISQMAISHNFGFGWIWEGVLEGCGKDLEESLVCVGTTCMTCLPLAHATASLLLTMLGRPPL